jgi:hypothetical protein
MLETQGSKESGVSSQALNQDRGLVEIIRTRLSHHFKEEYDQPFQQNEDKKM